MPYVFISHLSEDNSRLAVYVARLLEALDESVEVWIDTPERVRPDLGSNVRVKAIPPGTQWNKEIETAVENASCVLAFWSESFPLRGSRNVFIREIDRGRKYDCCVQVAINAKAECKIPAPFTDDQILEVGDLGNNPAHKAQFDRTIKTVKQLIEAPPRRTQSLPVPDHLLPYLANRHPQIRPICRTVRRNYGASGERSTTRAPSLFVVPCRYYDATNTFSWRLASKDGPEYFGFDLGRDTPDWVREEKIIWPLPTTPDSFTAEFKSYNEDDVSGALKQSKLRGRPVCFSTWIDVATINEEFGASIGAWVQSWPSLLAEATKKILPEDVRSLPQPPVVALLFLRFEFKRGWLSRWLGIDDSQMWNRYSELQKLESGVTGSTIVDFRVLAPLGLVTQDDALTWLTLDQVMRKAAYYGRATTAVDRLFDAPKAQVPMKDFANALL